MTLIAVSGRPLCPYDPNLNPPDPSVNGRSCGTGYFDNFVASVNRLLVLLDVLTLPSNVAYTFLRRLGRGTPRQDEPRGPQAIPFPKIKCRFGSSPSGLAFPSVHSVLPPLTRANGSFRLTRELTEARCRRAFRSNTLVMRQPRTAPPTVRRAPERLSQGALQGTPSQRAIGNQF